MNIESYKKYGPEVYKIIGAAMEVHQVLGFGLLEAVYNEALCMELKRRGIDAESEVEVPCYYKGERMKKEYRMDVVVGDVVCELKSVSEIVPSHRLQLFNYLRLTKKKIGLLINFGGRSVYGERYAYDEEENECYLIDKNMRPMVMNSDWLDDE